MPYYRPALARVHHEGFGGRGDACAPGVLAKLRPVRERGGVGLELGCGSGALTRHLVAAGHPVIGTDAWAAMLALAREAVPGVEAVWPLALPDDQLPAADAVVSVGHVLSYLPTALAVERAFRAVAAVLRPGGVLAVDLLDWTYRPTRAGKAPVAMVNDEWMVVVAFDSPDPGPLRPRHHDVRAQCVRRLAARRRASRQMSLSPRRMWCVCLPTRG